MKKVFVKKIRFYLRPVRGVWEWLKGSVMLRVTDWRFNRPVPQGSHRLPGKLVLSLTSYTPRFTSLEPTLKCLLSQTVKPDHVILWVAGDSVLPKGVLALTARGLEIRYTQDVGPYTKLVPALAENPDAFIVTADDDTYYPPDWLETLVAEWDGRFDRILCHRAHRMRFDPDGTLRSYQDWQRNIRGPVEETHILPLGVGGVLYPPHALLHPDVLDRSCFLRLSPGADDLWFYWMARKNGATFKKTGWNRGHTVWPASQKITLGAGNTGQITGVSANDVKMRNLIDRYGPL